MKLKIKKEFIIIFVLTAIVICETALLIKFWPKKPEIKIKPPVSAVAKIAIIIDDWGYSDANMNFLKEINIALDISVLPFLPYSKLAAEQAQLNNKEVMLHLPLEPHPNSQIRLENRVIFASMAKEGILKILDDALKSVPYAKGINNHMGSLATEKKSLMAVIFREMKKRKLFFVDSLVTEKSVCKDLAEELQLKFGERSVFLDNYSDSQYIRKQFLILINKAKKHGFAIGIGHDHLATLKAIKELAPEIEKQGVKFVFASELVK